MTEKERELALYCLKASSDYHSEVCEECINYPNCDHTIQDDVTETIIKCLEQESKTGHWIRRNAFLVPWKCSECNYESERYDNYCPNCGARMVESEVEGMRVKDYKCKCGHNDFFFADKGNQKGIYCSYCGKWYKWADKDEQNLTLEQEPILDKIRDEVLKLDDPDYDFEGYYKAVTDALKIIDKYKTESEVKE